MPVAVPLDELVSPIHERVHGGGRREQIEVGEIPGPAARQLQQEQVLDAKCRSSRSEILPSIGDDAMSRMNFSRK